jgi:hypothetical protein
MIMKAAYAHIANRRKFYDMIINHFKLIMFERFIPFIIKSNPNEQIT